MKKSSRYLSHDRPRRYAALALGFEVPPAAFSTADEVIKRRVTSAVGQFATNRHVRVTSGSAPIADINLGQLARQAARRPDQTGRI
jgi:hypothetical protein